MKKVDKQDIIGAFKSIVSIEDLVYFINKVSSLLYEKPAMLTTGLLRAIAFSPRMHRYTTFFIKKKSGGYRSISSPTNLLKQVQKCLNLAFQILYKQNGAAFGFVPGCSIVDNASLHVGKKYVFNIDLKDFFPSVREGRIFYLLQHEPFYFSIDIASIMARLCCIWEQDDKTKGICHGVLPQGAPTSPILTNFVCIRMDRRLSGLARRFRLEYSRYADDITFSSNYNCYNMYGEFIEELNRIIRTESFKINTDKIRLQNNSFRQSVTGLVVNKKVNLVKSYSRELKMYLYYWEHYGYRKAEKIFNDYRNKKAGVNNSSSKEEGSSLMRVMCGKLVYMKMVKGERNSMYASLYQRYINLLPKPMINSNDASKNKELQNILGDIMNIVNYCNTPDKEVIKSAIKIMRWEGHTFDKIASGALHNGRQKGGPNQPSYITVNESK